MQLVKCVCKLCFAMLYVVVQNLIQHQLSRNNTLESSDKEPSDLITVGSVKQLQLYSSRSMCTMHNMVSSLEPSYTYVKRI